LHQTQMRALKMMVVDEREMKRMKLLLILLFVTFALLASVPPIILIGGSINCESAKDILREKCKHLRKDDLSLVDLAYDSTQNRLFEMKTLELLTEECGYKGTHLGGSRKPDGVIYTHNLPDNYGVIIDTKAYSGGYNLPISQADEMQRYIMENQRRDEKENPNKWWLCFGDDVRRFYFMFVSGHFKGRYQEQIDRISQITKTRGVAIAICDLLMVADKRKGSRCSLEEVERELFFTYNCKV